MKNEEAQPPDSRSSDQFGLLPEVLLARSPLADASGPVYEKPISQGVFRQSAWPSHTAACGYLAIASEVHFMIESTHEYWARRAGHQVQADG